MKQNSTQKNKQLGNNDHSMKYIKLNTFTFFCYTGFNLVGGAS
jgi:hypothetical protein